MTFPHYDSFVILHPLHYKKANRHGRLLLNKLKGAINKGDRFYLYNVIGVLAFGPLLWLVSDLFCCNVFLSPDQSRRRNCRPSCCSRAAERGGGPEAAAAHGCRALQGEIQGMSATAKTSAQTLWTARGRFHRIPANVPYTCSQQVKEQKFDQISVALCLLITSH